LEDRFTKGFIAGLIAGIVLNIVNLISYYALHYAKKRYLDYIGAMIYGRLPITIFEQLFSQLIDITFSGILGIIFSYLLTRVSSKNYLLKGALFSTGMWLISFITITIFKVSFLYRPASQTVFSHFITCLIHGLVLAATFHWLDNKSKK